MKGGVGTDLHLRLAAGLSEGLCKTIIWCTLINNHQLHIVYIYIYVAEAPIFSML